MNTNIKLISGAIVALFMIVGGAEAKNTNPAPLNNITSIPADTSTDKTPEDPLLISDVAIPQPDLADYVVNTKDGDTALHQLGKALYWDMQLGSDGVQACASCHFHAGADNRSKNQINPDTNHVGTPTFNPTFQIGFGANYQLTKKDFPFHKLSNPNCRIDDETTLCLKLPRSVEKSNTDSVTASQGIFNTTLLATVAGQATDKVTSDEDTLFNVGSVNTRRVEPRNTPTVINAVYYQLQFWDGRAKDIFNGANPGGKDGASNAHLFIADNPTALLTPASIALAYSSLASQTTGPPLSVNEMSASGRTLPQIGFKFLARKSKELHALKPLSKQLVHPDDSVLGPLSQSPKKGLKISYETLITTAFKPQWWNSNQIVEVDSNGNIINTASQIAAGETLKATQFKLIQWNFSLFAAVAMQRYESTLKSDQTPFDKFQAGDTNALSPSQTAGLAIFVNNDIANGGGNCNKCHEIPEFTIASTRHTGGNSELIPVNGFFSNYGVTPPENDPGPFKTPNLRNIALTAPYFHNGGMGNLKEVVQFYNRGKDGPTPAAPSTISRLNLSEEAQANLVEFLKVGLTDRRVALNIEPFDHPELFIPNGELGTDISVTAVKDSNWPIAIDLFKKIPAVGKHGLSKAPSNFLESENQEQDNNKSDD